MSIKATLAKALEGATITAMTKIATDGVASMQQKTRIVRDLPKKVDALDQRISALETPPKIPAKKTKPAT